MLPLELREEEVMTTVEQPACRSVGRSGDRSMGRLCGEEDPSKLSGWKVMTRCSSPATVYPTTDKSTGLSAWPEKAMAGAVERSGVDRLDGCLVFLDFTSIAPFRPLAFALTSCGLSAL